MKSACQASLAPSHLLASYIYINISVYYICILCICICHYEYMLCIYILVMYVYMNVHAQNIYNTYAYQPLQIFMKMVLFGCANSE